MTLLQNEVVQELLAGTVGGCAGICVSQPFDVIKVRLQSTAAARSGPSSATARPPSVISELLRGFKAEGAVALYRGIAPPLVSNGVLNAVLFAAYGGSLRFLGASSDGSDASASTVFLAGSMSGMCTSAISIPTELIKIRQQVEAGRTQTSSMLITRRIVADSGLLGLYRGGIATVARDAWSFGVYFWTYNELKVGLLAAWGGGSVESDAEKTASPVGEAAAVCVAGAVAGVIAWTVCYPIDSVKTIIQTSEHVSTGSPVTEWFRLLMATPRDRLWRGYRACVARAIPLNGVTFLFYEFSLKLMRQSGDDPTII